MWIDKGLIKNLPDVLHELHFSTWLTSKKVNNEKNNGPMLEENMMMLRKRKSYFVPLKPNISRISRMDRQYGEVLHDFLLPARNSDSLLKRLGGWSVHFIQSAYP